MRPPSGGEPTVLDRVFRSGGETGAMMRRIDWTATPLGPVERWPQNLRIAVGICLDSAFPMNIFWGPELTQIYNDAYIPVLGTKHPRALGQNGRECWIEVWDVLGPLYEHVASTGEAIWSADLLLQMDRKDYVEETYFTFSYSPIRNEAGGVDGVLVTCTETTERVLHERRLQTLRDLGAQSGMAGTAEEACRLAAEVLAAHAIDIPFAAVYLVDAAGTSAELHGAAGLAPGHAAGPLTMELAANGAWPLADATAARVPIVVDHLSTRFGPLPGGPWPVAPEQALVLPIAASDSDRVTGVLVAGVSPRRALDDAYRSFLELVAGHLASNVARARAYEAERRRAESLADLDRAKTAFFSNVSHELRTPLALQLGPLADALGDTTHPLDAAQRERLVIAHRNSLRLLRLVNTLLDFSRIEAGRVDAAFEPADLCALTLDAAGAFRSAMERAGLAYDVRCEPLPEPIFVDRDMWEKIVLNLVSNAFKFTLDGGVAVALRWTGKAAVLEVRDTGVGIEPDQVPHLFERFHRVRGARGRTHEGSGIGLALVQELVRLHGGGIEVTSTAGQGTTFTVTIPRGAEHLPAGRVSPPRPSDPVTLGAQPFVEEAILWLPEPSPPETSGELAGTGPAGPTTRDAAGRILLVDDNADMRTYVTRLLETRYTVEAVADAETALASALAIPPALVLSDVMLPGLDGFQLLHALRDDPATRMVPVILLSARAGVESRVEGLDAGADDYLVKPFSARELLARIGAHLALAAVRREANARERELRAIAEAERHRLHDFLVQTPAMILVTRGPEHVIEFMNTAYAHAIRAPDPAPTLGKRLVDLLPEIEGQGFIELLDHVYATGEPTAGTETLVVLERPGADAAEEAYFNFVYRPMRGAHGEVEGILVQAVEVTEQVRARRRVEQSETQLRLVTDALPALVAYIDREYRYRFVNRTYADWFGIDPATLLGRSARDLVGDAEFERLRPNFDRALAGEHVRAEAEIARPGGGTRPIVSTYVPDVDADGTVRGYVALVQDLTEWKAAEAALQQSEDKLRHAQKMEAVGTLAGGVAHEVNNMMTAVIGFGELAQRQLAGHPSHADVGEMVKAAQRAAGVTQQLLAFSRRQVLQPQTLDVNAVVVELAKMLSRLLGSDVELALELAPSLGPVRADRGQLEQVFVNLALNARDAMRDGGRLTVETANVTLEHGLADAETGVAGEPGPYVMLAIHDTGTGMSDETRARAFEPFFTTKPVGRGTGLGLATVYGIISQSGGSVGIESEPGRGTTVRIHLPWSDAPNAAVPAASAARTGGHETVLVVEDEELVRVLACRTLEAEGYTVLEARNGREALERAAAEDARIDLILSDIVMPDIGGRELGRLLTERDRAIPMLYMSGYTGDHVAHHRLLDPGTPFVQKPFAPATLAVQVRAALDRAAGRAG